MENTSLQELYVEELRDLLNAENQILKALPRLTKAASDPQLQQAFTEHMEQTRGQVDRLQQIFSKMGMNARSKRCRGMEGILEEGKELLDQDFDPQVQDAGLILSAQKVEHYEIAGYGTACEFAKQLGDEEAARLLQQTLDEEEETDRKLSQLAQSKINQQAKHPA